MPSTSNEIKNINKKRTTYILYPNPSSGTLSIDGSIESDTKVEIYNIIGKLVFKDFITGHKDLESSMLGGKGIYIVRIGNNESFTCQKVIIN